MRDQERLTDATGSGNIQERACLNMWRELVGEFMQEKIVATSQRQ
jgi:hypothetical protein